MNSARYRYTDESEDKLELVITNFDMESVLFKAINEAGDASVLVELDQDAVGHLITRLVEFLTEARPSTIIPNRTSIEQVY